MSQLSQLTDELVEEMIFNDILNPGNFSQGLSQEFKDSHIYILRNPCSVSKSVETVGMFFDETKANEQVSENKYLVEGSLGDFRKGSLYDEQLGDFLLGSDIWKGFYSLYNRLSE